MALFPWKKKDDSGDKSGGGNGGAGGGSGGSAAGGGFEFSPEKGEKFFERASTLHDATNYGYAMNLWLRGLRFAPDSLKGIEGFFKSAGQFFTENPKGEKDESYRSTAKELGRSDLDKYLSSLLEWSAHPTEASYAVKAMECASGLGLSQPTVWISLRAIGAVGRDKKPRKEHLVAIMNALKKFDKLEEAVQAGEAAVRLDPTDGKLAGEVKNLAADWTTKRGGFDQTGQEGGFRSNLRDAAKQRSLEEQGRVVTTEEVLDRQVASARADYETTNDRPNAIKFIDTLLKRAKPADEEEALRVAMEWHEKSQEYRFRETADTIRVNQLRRAAAALKAEAAKPDAGDEAKAAYTSAIKDWMRARVRSMEGQIAAYPTDLNRKFELAQLYYQIGKYEEAIALLQEAKSDAKNRAKVFFFLGLSFQKIGWNDEAIETLRQAQGMQTVGDESGELELKYGLMEALLARATEQGALPDAEEAYKLASQIAIQNISYSKIRARRDELKALIAKLKGGAPA